MLHRTEFDAAIEEVNSIPENYGRFIELIHVVSRRHIPRGCISNCIPGLTEKSKSLCEAYKRQYSSNPFGESTLDTRTKFVDTMKEQKGINGRISSCQLIGLTTDARRGRLLGIYPTTQPLQTLCVWSTHTKSQIIRSSMAEEYCQQSQITLYYQLWKESLLWCQHSVKKKTEKVSRHSSTTKQQA